MPPEACPPYAGCVRDSPERRSLPWVLDETFVVLGHGFRIRTSSSFAADLLLRMFADCRDRAVAPTSTYELDLSPDPERPSSWLVRDGSPLFRNADEASIVARLGWEVMNEAVSGARDLFTVHAGSVVAPNGGAVVLPAASGGGKTTMVAGLVRAGFSYLSDEMAAFDPATGLTVPVPRALSIKPGTFEALSLPAPRWMSERAASLLGGVWPIRADDLRKGSGGDAAPLRFVIAPLYRRGQPTELLPITRAAGLAEMIHNAFNIEPFGGSRGVQLLGRLMKDVICYRLNVGDLNDAVAAVVEAVSSG